MGMGEWVALDKKSFKKLWRTVKWRLNTRNYGRVGLLFIHSQTNSWSGKRVKHVKYKGEILIKNTDGTDMRNQIHDCYYDNYGRVPELEIIIKIAKMLPKEIHSLARQWGWNDTEVVGKIYAWMREGTVVFYD